MLQVWHKVLNLQELELFKAIVGEKLIKMKPEKFFNQFVENWLLLKPSLTLNPFVAFVPFQFKTPFLFPIVLFAEAILDTCCFWAPFPLKEW